MLTSQRALWPALAAWAALLMALPACDDPGVIPELSADSSTFEPLATVAVPADETHDWSFDGESSRLSDFGDDRVLFVDAMEGDDSAPRVVSLPIPDEAKGAGQIALRVMSDAGFRVGLQVGEAQLRSVEGSNTRRLWREILFTLPQPLRVSPGDRLMVRVEACERPLFLGTLRFMP